ncbi:MAG TPA: Flp family type IVb pilin [Usitatibacter sp.]|nr:Flp family type IVb pilin [Usitatibacter sp.]
MRFTEKVRRFVADDSGSVAIEYGLLAALIAVLIIAGAKAIGTNLGTLFTDISGCLTAPAGCSLGSGGETPPG